MGKVPEQTMGLNNEAIEAALGIAQVSMASAERMMHLQIEAAKIFLAEQTETATALTEAKDAEAMMALRAQLAEQAVESAVGYSRKMYEVASEAQQQLSKLVEKRFASYQNEMTTAVEKMMQAVPGGSNSAAEAVKSTFAATQAALDSMTKAARQAAELAEANVKAVTEAATSAMTAAKKK